MRAGNLVSLPVLMNDHDPNEDVLSIDPASVTGLDPGFGTASITDNGQRITVRIAPDASGSATLAYAVSDGTTAGRPAVGADGRAAHRRRMRPSTPRRSGAGSSGAWSNGPSPRWRAAAP